MKTNPNKAFFWSFMTAILFLIIASIFSGCVLTKNQKFKFLRDNCTVASLTTIHDTTYTKQEVKIDTFYKSIPGPIQYFPSPCEKLCDSLGNLKPFKQTSTKNGITQSLESIGNVLVQKCDVDSLLLIEKDLRTTITNLRTVNKEIQIHTDCKLPHLTDWYVFWAKLGKILSIVMIIYIALRVLKVYFKTVPWLAWISKIII